MDKVRWETLVLAAAILVGALVIASSMRANRYAFMPEAGLGDTQTGELYIRGTPDQLEQSVNSPKEEKRRVWIRTIDPLK
jgi:hypothetical protein